MTEEQQKAIEEAEFLKQREAALFAMDEQRLRVSKPQKIRFDIDEEAAAAEAAAARDIAPKIKPRKQMFPQEDNDNAA